MKRNIEVDPEVLLADGFEGAFIGIVQQFYVEFACYDYDKCIKILTKEMTIDEAIEHMEFNVIGSYVGKHTPCFLHKMKIKELD
jgi:hypothetical protein